MECPTVYSPLTTISGLTTNRTITIVHSNGIGSLSFDRPDVVHDSALEPTHYFVHASGFFSSVQLEQQALHTAVFLWQHNEEREQ